MDGDCTGPGTAPRSGTQPRTVHVKTFGCQMNIYDSERIVQALTQSGYESVSDPTEADLLLLNTCSVREKAEQKFMSEVGRLRRHKTRGAVVGVCGCVAQQHGQKLLDRFEHIDLVAGPDNIAQIPSLLEQVRGGDRICATRLQHVSEYHFAPSGQVVRRGPCAYVTIMKGCNNYCAFCIVPYVRGREVSKPAVSVVQEVESLVGMGVREVTLLGQNVNSYCDGTHDFPALLRRVNKVQGLERIRFTTSHPVDCSDELIGCFGRLDKLCEHIHLPLQSGSNAVLQRMNRRYTREHYVGLIERLRHRSEDIGITTDVIVGYPGETDQDFHDTLTALEAIRFDSIFSFKYSVRPNTAAARWDDDVGSDEKQRRLEEVIRLQREITIGTLESLRGTTVDVLVEGPSARRGMPGHRAELTGRTRRHLIVNFEAPHEVELVLGAIVPVCVEAVRTHTLFGRIVETGHSCQCPGAHRERMTHGR